MSLWQAISDDIASTNGDTVTANRGDGIGGGCINQAFRIQGEKQDYFVKTNSASRLDMFEAEADGLRELAASNTIHIPEPLCSGTADGSAYLVMEYIDMGGGSGAAMERLGEGLARMHRTTKEQFGWYRDNTIGSTHQPNAWNNSWINFMRDERLGYQLQLAERIGHGGNMLQAHGERLLESLPVFFDSHDPQASLLHGDLWSGNYSIDTQGKPVIFDPAVYYGDREADLAMTELFGGFSGRFYDAYNDCFPIDPGYKVRKTLYNLYHILNHANMFGGGYLSQALGMIDRLNSEAG